MQRSRKARPDESRSLADWEMNRSPLDRRSPRGVRGLGRALGRAFAWYEWVLFVLVFPLALVIYWVFRLLCGAFDARIPPPRRGVASPSFRVGASWRTAPWFPPEMIWKLQPPGIEPGVLRRLVRRLTRWL